MFGRVFWGQGGGVYSKGARPACVYLGQTLGLGIFGIPRKLHGIVPWKHIVLCNVLLYYLGYDIYNMYYMGTRRGSLGMKIHMALGVNHRIYGSIPKGIRVELTVLLASWSGGPGPRGGYI